MIQMSRMRKTIARTVQWAPFMISLTSAMILGAALARVASAQGTTADSARAAAAATAVASARTIVFQRAQRLVNDGFGAEGRTVLDSLLNATEPRSADEAEVLFWRATLAESWEQAQRDYLRVMLEHDRSPRAASAMLRLAQGELARGDRQAALRYLERLASEAPESSLRAEAGLWQGRLLIDRGARDQGCAVLRGTRDRVPSGALELENQYEYLLKGCPAIVASAMPVTPTMPAPATLPSPASSPASSPTVNPPSVVLPPSETDWSVQVAAWPTKEEAEKFVADVRARGYDARIDGTIAPFRVRFGKYRTREAATAAMNAYKTKERSNAFLVPVPRG